VRHANAGFDPLKGGVECSGVGELEGLGGVELVGAGGVDETLEPVGTAPQVARETELSGPVGEVGLGAVMSTAQWRRVVVAGLPGGTGGVERLGMVCVGVSADGGRMGKTSPTVRRWVRSLTAWGCS
jgi:hypothetical protein